MIDGHLTQENDDNPWKFGVSYFQKPILSHVGSDPLWESGNPYQPVYRDHPSGFEHC